MSFEEYDRYEQQDLLREQDRENNQTKSDNQQSDQMLSYNSENLGEFQSLLYEYEGGADNSPEAQAAPPANPPVDDQKEKLPPSLAPKSYAFMDGLRGIGSFAVYLSHFHDQFFPWLTKGQVEKGVDNRYFPEWAIQSPIKVFYHGYFWVVVFFILSGFVLPLRFFKTGKETCITGGTFRRYLRLMLPVLMILSLYHLFAQLDAFGERTFLRVQKKTFLELLSDGLFGTWFGDCSWSTPTWTLSIELVATFFIYLLAQTAVKYRQRWAIYLFACMLVFVPQCTDGLNFPNKTQKFHLTDLIVHTPIFFFGVIFADIETLKDQRKPLDYIRALPWGWKILVNGILLTLFFSLGSYQDDGRCLRADDGNCEFWRYATLGWYMPKPVAHYIGGISIIILSLTSEWAQWLLGSVPFQFMGRISFSLYLVHEIFIEWAQLDSYYYFIGQDYDPNSACAIVFFLYTPILIVVSYFLTILVDDPSKDFAYEVDVQSRITRPPPIRKDGGENTEESIKEHYSCLGFSKRSWKMLGFVIWLLLVLTVTQIYQATKPERLHHDNEVPEEYWCTQTVLQYEKDFPGQSKYWEGL